MATPIDAQGTVFTFNDGTTAQTIGGVQSFSLTGTKPERDVTTLASTSVQRKLGLPDNGNLTLNVLYDRSDAGQAAMLAADVINAVREVTMTLSSGDVATFNAYVKRPPVDGGADDDLKSTFELTLNTDPVWT